MFVFANAQANNIYPFHLKKISEISGGKALIVKDENRRDYLIYIIKYDFNKRNEIIEVHNNLDANNYKAIVLTNSKILSHSTFQAKLLTLVVVNDELQILAITNDGNIVKYASLITTDNIDFNNCQLINIIKDSEYLINLDGKLYRLIHNDGIFNTEYMTNINGKIIKISNDAGFSDIEYAVLEEGSTGLIINFFNHQFQFKSLSKLVSYSINKWLDLGAQIAYITSPDNKQCLMQIIDKSNGLIRSSFWIDAPIDWIDIASQNNIIQVSYIQQDSEGYILNIAEVNQDNPKIQPQRVRLLSQAINPKLISRKNSELLLVFSNYFIIANEFGEIKSASFYPIESEIGEIIGVDFINNQFLVYSSNKSLIFEETNNDYWFINKIINDIEKYILTIILLIALIIFIQLYRHQKRLANELLDLPNIGLLFVFDSGGRLINLNNIAKEFLEISGNIPLKRFFRYYVHNSKVEKFAEIIDNIIENKETINQKVTININNSETEWLCKAIPLRNITGLFRGVVLSAVDITEQLERKRLSNWAQLAHDMQTNLSTIKLNAEHLDVDISLNNTKRQHRIIFQVKLLMQRVRDIVTVGRSDTLNIDTYDVSEICAEVRNEFDDLMFPNVTFVLECKSIAINCDKPKLIRAIRNAAENGIKALKGELGIIRISSNQDRNMTIITVEDNGIGMDEETKKKMLTPYFTTASKSGGSGIGTMIMQHVTEMHNGYLIVNSEKGKGTQVIFHIPNSLHGKKEKLIDSER